MSSLNELQDLIHEKFGLDPSTLDINASMRDQGIDSLTLLEFVFAVEDRFGISFPEERSDVDTLAGIAAVIDGIRNVKA